MAILIAGLFLALGLALMGWLAYRQHQRERSDYYEANARRVIDNYKKLGRR